jgi:hypothetical protein
LVKTSLQRLSLLLPQAKRSAGASGMDDNDANDALDIFQQRQLKKAA